jgi:hypothetical protein
MSRDDVWRLLIKKEPETVVLERRALEKQYQGILKNYEVVKKTLYYVVLQRS